MDVYHLQNGHPPCRLDAAAALPETGYFWCDCVRDIAADWDQQLKARFGLGVDQQHVDDSLNAQHPSFFDNTADYDMLVFQGLGPRDVPFPLETRTTAFFLFSRVLVTVRARDSVSVNRVREKLLEGRLRAPPTLLLLTHTFLDMMIDRFLDIREPMAQWLTKLQDDLLDPRTPREDWRALLDGRKQVRQLEALSENQSEAIDAWRRNSGFDWDAAMEVRMRDLGEHVQRIVSYAGGQERDLEAAVQLHFAVVSHRTNRIVQGLTVLSGIFFPLTLITGIYGMNFSYMPELSWHYGYFYVLGLLAVVGGSLYWYFRKRRFF